jgi:glycosyltransferase involved in cell wall biosynthesis
VIWHAPLLDPSGYADEARQFVLGLDDSGERVRAVSLNWSDKRAALAPDEARRLERLLTTTVEAEDAVASIWHIFPRFFRRNPRAVLNVGRTTFETDRIPADWVPLCNAMDEIWVPTDFNMETFQRAGVDGARLFKVPPGIDTAAYAGEVAAVKISDGKGFNFLSVFDWTLRKGWDVLLRAYVEEFDELEDVALVLKLSSSLGYTAEQISLMVQSFIENNLGRDPSRIPEVVLLHQDLTQEQMPALYRAVDAYVMASRGEGWGRPYMEAMATGLPVIGTGWGGNTEFMTDANSYLIASQLVEVPEAAVREAAHFRGHCWAEPDGTHLRGLLREVYEDREGARRKGALARTLCYAGPLEPISAGQ